MRMNFRALGQSLLAVSLAIAAAGCNRSGADSVTSQVMVKVDDSELTIYQLNSMLQRMPAPPPEQAEAKKAEVIKALIELQVSSDQALKLGLDRKPEVLTVLELARRNMLSQTYLANYAQPLAKPAPADVRQFYQQNPHMFERRKKYLLLELVVQGASAATVSRLNAAVASGRPLEEIAASLRAEGVPHYLALGPKSSDELEPSLAGELGEAGVGSVKMDKSVPTDWDAVEIKQIQPAPMELTQAETAIAERLAAEKSKVIIADQLARLVQVAKIEYVGEYAKYAPKSEEIAPVTPVDVSNKTEPGQ